MYSLNACNRTRAERRRGPELQLGLLHGLQEPKYWTHYMLLPRMDWMQSNQDLNKHSDVGCRHCKWWLIPLCHNIWPGRQREGVRGIGIDSHLLVHFPDVHNGQVWAGLKIGAGTLIQVSCVSSRNTTKWAITWCLSGYALAKNWRPRHSDMRSGYCKQCPSC